MNRESIIEEAFHALRNPASDPDGFGKNFCLTTAEVDEKRHWVICAVFRRPDGTQTLMPLFYALRPGQKVKIEGFEGVTAEDGAVVGVRPVD